MRLAAQALVPGIRAPNRGLVNFAWASNPLLIAVNVLTAFRLTRLWTRDSLPPLPWLRQTVQTRWGHRAWTELMTCPHCAGVWISAAVLAIASSPWGTAWLWLAAPLAVSAVVGLLASYEEKG